MQDISWIPRRIKSDRRSIQRLDRMRVRRGCYSRGVPFSLEIAYPCCVSYRRGERLACILFISRNFADLVHFFIYIKKSNNFYDEVPIEINSIKAE